MARFNYESKCANLRKCARIMKRFLRDASDMVQEGDNGEEYEQFISLRRGNNGFRAIQYTFDKIIEYDFTNAVSVVFRQNMVMRDFRLQGFSHVTLSLLHELGHLETFDDVPEGYDRLDALLAIKAASKDDDKIANLMYYSLPDEWLATQWAIDWLSEEENRKRAKQFEKEFFRAWRGK